MKQNEGTTVAQILILFSYFIMTNANGIVCYQCTVEPPLSNSNKLGQSCSEFDESARFQVLCPSSTLCMKRSTHYKFPNGTTIVASVQRGCAPQKYTHYFLDYDIRISRKEERIDEDAYSEGCFIGEDNGSPYGPPEFCYCGYHLCNGKLHVTYTKKLYMFALIVTSLTQTLH